VPNETRSEEKRFQLGLSRPLSSEKVSFDQKKSRPKQIKLFLAKKDFVRRKQNFFCQKTKFFLPNRKKISMTVAPKHVRVLSISSKLSMNIWTIAGSYARPAPGISPPQLSSYPRRGYFASKNSNNLGGTVSSVWPATGTSQYSDLGRHSSKYRAAEVACEGSRPGTTRAGISS
jgi:hypothetical protein